MDRLNEIIRTIAGERPEVVLIDVAGYPASIGVDTDQGRQSLDGVHDTRRGPADWRRGSGQIVPAAWR